MSSTKPFPFPSGTAPEIQVVEWIAEVLYPKEYRKGGNDRSNAKKRVRCRISYARNVTKDHRLRRLENGHINVSQFFNWAVLQKKWEALIKVDGLRADTTVDLSEGEPIPIAYGLNPSTIAPLHGRTVPWSEFLGFIGQAE